ncbi:MAG: hypothetical protein ACI4XJ_08755 [Eubacteriales bacterium]
MKKQITITSESSSVESQFESKTEDAAVRERLRALRSAGFSDELIKTRLNNYRYRYIKGNQHFAYAGNDYMREVKLMLDAYTKLAEERGLI